MSSRAPVSPSTSAAVAGPPVDAVAGRAGLDGIGSWAMRGAVAAVVVAGIALRFVTTSDLWLDEALSVNIAALPIGDMLEALRRDGHPPLYYVLLHGWIDVFGDTDFAVRSLSGLFAVAALPFAWLAGRRYAGHFGGAVALVLIAANPFVVRYATETRMYTLVMLIVLVGWIAVRRAMDSPSVGRLAVVSLISGLLLLTHYWSFYLLGAVGLLALWRLVRPGLAEERRTAGRLALALAAGGLLFVPWLPAFLDQLGSTGTPWGTAARPAVIIIVVLRDYGGNMAGESDLVGFALALMIIVAVFGRPGRSGRIELDVHPRRATQPEILVLVGTLTIAVVAGYLTQSAFASRYSAMIFPFVLLLVTFGICLLPRRFGVATLTLLAVAGLVTSVVVTRTHRTQSGDIAAAIEEQFEPGDIVVYCPDQLGPGVSRYLPAEMRGVTYPDQGDPRFVDWVDYEARLSAADPEQFAREIADDASNADVFLVSFSGYRTHSGTCERISNELADDDRVAEQLVTAEADIFEPASLHRYAPSSG